MRRKNFNVIPSNEIRSPKYQELRDKVCQLQEKLEEKLNNEENGLLNELMDAIADENCSYAQSKFIRGYREASSIDAGQTDSRFYSDERESCPDQTEAV